jgi:hypothetical protein
MTERRPGDGGSNTGARSRRRLRGRKTSKVDYFTGRTDLVETQFNADCKQRRDQ